MTTRFRIEGPFDPPYESDLLGDDDKSPLTGVDHPVPHFFEVMMCDAITMHTQTGDYKYTLIEG